MRNTLCSHIQVYYLRLKQTRKYKMAKENSRNAKNRQGK